MCRNENETLDGQPIIYDEVGDAIKFYLLGNEDDPSSVTIKVYGINELEVEYGGVAIHMPTDVLVRMADQLRAPTSSGGVNPEVLLGATNDQVIKFLKDRMEAMWMLLDDEALLPALLAHLVTVKPSSEPSECDGCDLCDEDLGDGGLPAEVIRQIVAESSGYDRGADGPNEDGSMDCDIEIDTSSGSFTMLRYAIRIAYETIRSEQVRERQRKR